MGLHAVQLLPARQTVDGTEDHNFHYGNAGGGQFREAIEQARTDPGTGAIAGSLTRSLRGSLSSNDLPVATVAVAARTDFGARL